MNIFMNLVKRSSEVGRIRGGVGASGEVGALLLPTLDLFAGLWPANSPSSLAGLTGILTQKLWQARDSGAIAEV